MIEHIEHPGYPWFRFEFHGDHRVYVIRRPRPEYAGPEVGTLITDGVQTSNEAKLIVSAFLAGYAHHASEPQEFRGNGPRHYNINLDTGHLGHKLNGQ